jgi:hypothetical protein
MATGDHLVIAYGPYQHHAIDLGDGQVIQYGGGSLTGNRIEIVPLDQYPARRVVWVLEEAAEFSADEIIDRALSRRGEDNYCLFSNNCEHFVRWCRTGRASSHQVRRAFRRTAAVAAKLIARRSHRQSARRMTQLASKRLAKSATPWLMLADVAQLGTEVAASNRGFNSRQSQQAGQAVGLGASAGIGALTAGPPGALVGVGMWAFGELAGSVLTRKHQESKPGN